MLRNIPLGLILDFFDADFILIYYSSITGLKTAFVDWYWTTCSWLFKANGLVVIEATELIFIETIWLVVIEATVVVVIEATWLVVVEATCLFVFEANELVIIKAAGQVVIVATELKQLD